MVLVHSVAANQLGGTKTALTRAGVPAERIGVRANGAAHEIYVPEEYEAAAKTALSGHTYTAGSKGKRGNLGASAENAAGAALVGATWVLAGALLFAFQSLFALAAVAPMLIVSVIWRSIRMRKRKSIETVYSHAPDLAWKDAALWAGAALVALFFAVAVTIVGWGGGL